MQLVTDRSISWIDMKLQPVWSQTFVWNPHPPPPTKNKKSLCDWSRTKCGSLIRRTMWWGSSTSSYFLLSSVNVPSTTNVYDSLHCMCGNKHDRYLCVCVCVCVTAQRCAGVRVLPFPIDSRVQSRRSGPLRFPLWKKVTQTQQLTELPT